MGFSSQQFRKEGKERPWKIHPAWRGIGCVLFLLVPIMAWFGAMLILQSSQVRILPYNLSKVVVIPFTHISVLDRLILPINHYFAAVNFQSGQLFFFVLLVVIGFGAMAFLYALLYKMAGPPRYGPFDVPPSSVR